MPKLFVTSLILLFVISSCKKSSSNSNAGVISATIDGTTTSFNSSATAVESISNGFTVISIVGFEGAAGSSNSMNIGIETTSLITIGKVYSDTSSANNLAKLVFIQQPGNNSYSDTTGLTQVTITNLSSDMIQGTFNGVVSLSGDSSQKHTIANGKFSLMLTVE